MLLPQFDTPETMRRLGFHCLEPRRFTVRAGAVVTVHASGWMLADKTLPPSEAETRCFRLYTVCYSGGGAEECDEHDVVFLVGETAWAGA